MMIAGIVDKNMDGRHGLVVAFQFFQHLSGCLSIDFLAFHKGELEGLKVKRALMSPSGPSFAPWGTSHGRDGSGFRGGQRLKRQPSHLRPTRS